MDDKLIQSAWSARDHAQPGEDGTMVGCAIKAYSGRIFKGWNIRGLWGTSIHAEVCAISQLVGSGENGIAVAVAADVEMFTPCGACLDWLMQFCVTDAPITVCNLESPEGHTTVLLSELYPLYPRR